LVDAFDTEAGSARGQVPRADIDVLFQGVSLNGHAGVRRSGFAGTSSVFFMDASKIEDVIDFWNLRPGT
jgi:hypothetical protein